MIVKGIIKTIDFSDNSCRVRIPLFETAASSGEVILKAIMLIQPGSYNGYVEGDVVFVDFENNDLGQPIVLGKLYLGAAKESAANTPGSLAVSNLKVTSKATLPIDTQLVLEDTSGAVPVENGITSYKSITDIIKALHKTAGDANRTADALNKTIEDQAGVMADYKVEYLIQLNTLPAPTENDHRWQVATPKQADGYDIWQKTTRYNNRGQILNVEIICLSDLLASITYTLRCSARIHAGPNQPEDIVIRAMKKTGSGEEILDTEASLYYKWGEDGAETIVEGPTLTLEAKTLKEKNLIITSKRKHELDKRLYVTGTETIQYTPWSSPLLQLDGDTNVILYSADGKTKLGDDIKLTANLSVNGDDLQAIYTWSKSSALSTQPVVDSLGAEIPNEIMITGIDSTKAITGTIRCTATVTQDNIFYGKTYSKEFLVTQTRVGDDAITYWLTSSCIVHTGKKHGKNIVITAMKQKGSGLEELDRDAILWWRFANAKTETGEPDLAWRVTENNEQLYQKTFTFSEDATENEIPDDDILILATHDLSFIPPDGAIPLDDDRVYETEEITFSPLNTPRLSLTNDFGEFACDSAGDKKDDTDTVSTEAELYLNGTKITDGVTYAWTLVDCADPDGNKSLNTATLTVKYIYANLATATCVATYKNESYTKVFTVSKNFQGIQGEQGPQGLPGNAATSYWLASSCIVHTGKKHGKDIIVSAMEKTGTSDEDLDKEAYLWYRFANAANKSWKAVTGDHYQLTISANSILNDDLLIIATHNSEYTPPQGNILLSDANVYDSEEIVFSPLNTPVIDLTSNSGEFVCDYTGAKINPYETVSTQAGLFLNGTRLPDADVTYKWELVNCIASDEKKTVDGANLTVKAIDTGKNTATATCTATYKEESYTKVFNIAKRIQGAPGDEAISYWLTSSCIVHTGKKHGEDITVVAKKQVGNTSGEENDTKAYLWYRKASDNTWSRDWTETTGTPYEKTFRTATIPDENLLIIATHNPSYVPDRKVIPLSDMNVYENEEITFSPLNTPTLGLTSDSGEFVCNYKGEKMDLGDTVSTEAGLYLNGTKLPDNEVKYEWTLHNCRTPNGANEWLGAILTVQYIDANTGTATCEATYKGETYKKVFTVAKQFQGEPGGSAGEGAAATSFWLTSTCTVHTGTKHDRDICVTAMKKVGDSPEKTDTEAILWWRFANAKTTEGDDTPWECAAEPTPYRLIIGVNDIIDDDLLILATHYEEFEPTGKDIPLTDADVYETEEITFSPLNTPILSLTNDSDEFVCDHYGNKVIADATVSTTAELHLNGSKLPDTDVTYKWILEDCKDIDERDGKDPNNAITGATLTVKYITAQSATATCEASYNNETYTKVFTVAKRIQGDPAMSYWLTSTCIVHTGTKHGKDIAVTAMAQKGLEPADIDTAAILWWRTDSDNTWTKATNGPEGAAGCRLVLTANIIPNEDILVLATHNPKFDGTTAGKNVHLSDSDVYETEEITFSPLNTPMIGLTNDSAEFVVDHNGVKMDQNDTVSTEAGLYLNGAKLTTGVVYKWTLVDCKDVNGREGEDVVTGANLTVKYISKNTATATCNATYNNETYTKVFTIAKRYQGEPGSGEGGTGPAGPEGVGITSQTTYYALIDPKFTAGYIVAPKVENNDEDLIVKATDVPYSEDATYVLSASETLLEEWSLTPPAHTDETLVLSWMYWTTVRTEKSNGEVSYSTPIIDAPLSGVYQLARGKNTTYYSDLEPTKNEKAVNDYPGIYFYAPHLAVGDCWFETGYKPLTEHTDPTLSSLTSTSKYIGFYIDAVDPEESPQTGKLRKVLVTASNRGSLGIVPCAEEGEDQDRPQTQAYTKRPKVGALKQCTKIQDNGHAMWENIGAELVANTLDVAFIQSLELTSKKITVLQDPNNENSKILFEANGLATPPSVQIAGFDVEANTLTTGDAEKGNLIRLNSDSTSQYTFSSLTTEEKSRVIGYNPSASNILRAFSRSKNLWYYDDGAGGSPSNHYIAFTVDNADFTNDAVGYAVTKVTFTQVPTAGFIFYIRSTNPTDDDCVLVSTLNAQKIPTNRSGDSITYTKAVSDTDLQQVVFTQSEISSVSNPYFYIVYRSGSNSKDSDHKGQVYLPVDIRLSIGDNFQVLADGSVYANNLFLGGIDKESSTDDSISNDAVGQTAKTELLEALPGALVAETALITDLVAESAKIQDLVADTINAASLTAKKITVIDQEIVDKNAEAGEDRNAVIFSADADEGSVTLGDFVVEADKLRSNTATGHVSISPTNIFLGAEERSQAPFYIQSNGNFKATTGEIGGFEIGNERLGGTKVGPVFKSKLELTSGQDQTYTITNPLADDGRFAGFIKDPSWVRVLNSNGDDVTGSYCVYESDSFYKNNDSYARITFEKDLDSDFVFYIASSGADIGPEHGHFMAVSNLKDSVIKNGRFTHGLAHTFKSQLSLAELRRDSAATPDAEITYLDLKLAGTESSHKIKKITLKGVKKGDYYTLEYVKNSNRAALLDTGWFILPSQSSEERRNRIFMTPTGSSASIAGAARNDWGLTVGDACGVALDGTFHASKANLSGTIAATEGTLGGFAFADNTLSSGNLKITSNLLEVSGETEGYLKLGMESIGSGKDKTTYPYLEFTTCNGKYKTGGMIRTADKKSGFMFTSSGFESPITYRVTASVSGSGTSVKVTGTLQQKTSGGEWVNAESLLGPSKTLYVKVKGKTGGFIGIGQSDTYGYATLSFMDDPTETSSVSTSSYGSIDFNSVSGCFFVSSRSDGATSGSTTSAEWTYTPPSASSIISLGSIIPGNTLSSWATADLGSGEGNHEWRFGYFDDVIYTNGCNKSDRKEKNTIDYNISKYDSLFDSLKPVSYKYNKGTSNRTHLGFIAQDIQDAVKQADLTSKDCAIVVIQGDGFDAERGEVVNEEATRYYIRLNELHALEVRQIQLLKEQVKQQSQVIEDLTQRLEKLESKN